MRKKKVHVRTTLPVAPDGEEMTKATTAQSPYELESDFPAFACILGLLRNHGQPSVLGMFNMLYVRAVYRCRI